MNKKFILKVLAVGVLIIFIGSVLIKKDKVVNDTASVTIETSVQEKVVDMEVYKNDEFGFEIALPKDWLLKEKEGIVDTVNKIFYLADIFKDNRREMSIVVHGDTPASFIYDTNVTKKILVNNEEHVAYLFPNGYECYDREERIAKGEKCGFFVIPIIQKEVEYRIWVLNTTKITNEHIQILKSFKLF